MKTVVSILTLPLFTLAASGQCSINFSQADLSCNGICLGSAIAIPTGTPPFIYSWSNSDTTQTTDSLCAGTYILTLTDSTACVAVDSVTITEPPPLIITVTATAASCSTCCDACITITPSGGCIPYTLQWAPSDPNTPPCSGCAGITYTVTVTDGCGCTIVDSITPDTIPIGTGIIIPLKEAVISIYPNPATNQFTVSGLAGYPAHLTLFDLTGTIIYQHQVTSNHQPINISHLSKGLYVWQLGAALRFSAVSVYLNSLPHLLAGCGKNNRITCCPCCYELRSFFYDQLAVRSEFQPGSRVNGNGCSLLDNDCMGNLADRWENKVWIAYSMDRKLKVVETDTLAFRQAGRSW